MFARKNDIMQLATEKHDEIPFKTCGSVTFRGKNC